MKLLLLILILFINPVFAADSTDILPSDTSLVPDHVSIRTVQLPGQGSLGVSGSVCYGILKQGKVDPFADTSTNLPLVIPRDGVYKISAKATVCDPHDVHVNLSMVVYKNNAQVLVVNHIQDLMRGINWYGSISAANQQYFKAGDVITYQLDTTVAQPWVWVVFMDGSLDAESVP